MTELCPSNSGCPKKVGRIFLAFTVERKMAFTTARTITELPVLHLSKQPAVVIKGAY